MSKLQIAQLLSEAMLRTSGSSRIAKSRWWLLQKIRKGLLRFSDPLVTYSLGKTSIIMPLSHNLPLFQKTFPDYSLNIGRIARHVYGKYPDMTLIDVGANVGDTVAILRNEMHFPILCIEGDEGYFKLLKLNVQQFEDVDVEAAFLGETTSTITRKITKYIGTATLTESAGDDAGKEITIKTLPEVLKYHPQFNRAKMLKIDTDGYDGLIIQGALPFLNQAKPVIFFEYVPHQLEKANSGLSIFQDLRQAGYTLIIIYENTGDYLLTASLDNHLLIEDIHHFYSGRDAYRYCDICAFHAEDADLCYTLRGAELVYFKQRRG